MKKIKEVLERAIFLVIGVIIALVLLGGRGPETTFASPQAQGSVANVIPICANLVTGVLGPLDDAGCPQGFQEYYWLTSDGVNTLNSLLAHATASEQQFEVLDERTLANEAMIFELWEGYADIQEQNAIEFGEFVAGIIPPNSRGKAFELWKGYVEIQEQNATEFGEFVDGVVAPPFP